MSNTRKNCLWIFLVTIAVAFFAFGCKKEVKVGEIYFDLVNDKQVIMLIGEELNLNDHVVVLPANATNKGYEIESFNPEIVSVNNGLLTAKAKGSAQIKVTSLQNLLKQDLMTVVVWESEVTLAAPANLRYSKDAQVVSFNSVPNAASYSLKINEDIYELGNSTSFKLKSQYFDTLANIQVKANAPTYTTALNDSQFSSALKIYQVGEVENLIVSNTTMAFERNSQDSIANIYFNGVLESEINENIKMLNDLDASYAGSKLTIDVEMVLPEDRKQEIYQQYGGDVQIYTSAKKSIEVDVIALPELKLASGVLEWQQDRDVKEYEAYLDSDKLIGALEGNKLDLSILLRLNDNAEHTVKIKPIVKGGTTNLATTGASSEIKVQKLAAPAVTLGESSVNWTEVENVTAYAFDLISGGTIFGSSTTATSLDMSNYQAGQYNFKVRAIADDKTQNEVHYISSNVVEYSFGKHAQVESSISDYILNLINDNNDKLIVLLDKETESVKDISSNVIKSDNNCIIDLKSMDFTAGEHTLTVKKAYNAQNKMLESDETSISFVQLEKIDEFSVSGGVAAAVLGTINEKNNAKVTIVTYGETLDANLIAEDNVYAYNTTNLDGTDFLTAGQYESRVFVYGDGSKTFGYRENGEFVACAEVQFEVLDVPKLSLLDASQETLSISKIENAQYRVFENGSAKSSLDTSYVFTLESGTKVFAVQAVGDGVKYLDSKVSDEINVSRLIAPTLHFNRETNVLSFVDENDSSLVASRVLTKDGVNYDYNFEGTLNLANDTVFTLTSLANVKVDGNYYLNSTTTTLSLIKLKTATNAKIENNKLVIETDEEECGLEIEFIFDDGTTETLETGDNNALINGNYTLPYAYNSGVYIIDLIDSNHNAIMDGFLQKFEVNIIVTKNDGLHIDSASTKFENLNLTRIDAQTEITTNDKSIVLEPTNQTVEHGLRLTIGAEEFVSDGAYKLVSTTSTLSYSYTDGKYNIIVLDNKYDSLISTLSFTTNELQFNIQVKYTHSLHGEECDLDSDYSSAKTLTVLKSATLIREGQSLQFNNVYPTFVAANYILLIDENQEMELTNSNAVLNDGTFTIDIEKVFENIDVSAQTDVHSVQVVVLNNTNNIALSNKGTALYFTKNPTVALSSFKNNNAENNATYVQFEKAEQAIIQNRKYVVTLKAGEIVKNKEFLDSSTILNFNLDKEEFASLTGQIEVYAQVLASGQSISADQKLVEIFNSNVSNKLNIVRVSNDMKLCIDNSVLTWLSQEGAFGYEIYKVQNGSYSILSRELVKSTSFNLDMLGVETEIELTVKAVGENEFTTNSLYAESVKVARLAAPSVGVDSGKIVLTFSSNLSTMLKANDVDITPYILNEEQEIAISLDKVNIDYLANTMTIEAYELLNYLGTSEIVAENCKFSFKVGSNNQDVNNIYYLSSAMTSAKLYGLFAPTNIRKTTDENNFVEQIMWKSNLNNVINGVAVAEKYLFKLVYTNELEQSKEFYSNDTKLVYKNASGVFVSYATIAASKNNEDISIIAPYGYDIDGDNEVIFGAGHYSIIVQAIPNSTDTGILLASSKYSSIFEYEIMPELLLKLEGGEVSWTKQNGATSYTVYITPNGEGEARTFTVNNNEEAATIKFGFDDIPNIVGICKVEVKALSTHENVLNSEISKPIYVYRLPKANSIHVDDGNLVFSANKYFTSAVIEFFDVSKSAVTHSETYTNGDIEKNLEELNVEDWSNATADINDIIAGEDNLKLYTVKLSEEGIVLASNKNYNINIILYGNTLSEGANNGFVKSAKFKTVSNLTVTKLSASVVGVEKGVVTFGTPTSITNSPKLNYILNKTDNGDFWKNDAIIYKIDLKYGTDSAMFYALDYYAFEQERAKTNCSLSYKLLTPDYEDLCALVYYTYEGKQLVFDVYYENTIDVAQRDHIRYHHTSETNENGENWLVTTLNTSELNNGYNEIDIANCSSFTFSVTILGGDSKMDENSADMTNPNTLGYLSAFTKNVRTIDRYPNNVISTKDGKIIFNNLTKLQNETPINIPVYKFIVKQLNADENEVHDQIYYVYYSSREEAEETAKINGDENVTFVEVELIEDNDTQHLFNLSKYISEGSYIITLQTLAGKANQNDGDYIINAKLPSGGSMNKIVYKLSETDLNAENGVLKFGQSYIIIDGVSYYYNCYELTINDGETDYVFKIDQSSQGVKIDASSRTVTYDLPQQITADNGQTLDLNENGQYLIKIRAMSGNIEGESGTLVLNSTYTKFGEEDVALSIRKTAIAKDVKIENGQLKWVVDNVNNHYRTAVKITYGSDNETYEIYKYSTYINDAYYLNGIYQYHYLTWEDFEDELELGYRENGYTVSLIVSSKTGNLLNSNPTENINFNVLQIVDNASIKAQNGILTWKAIANATESTQYRVIISGASNLEFITNEQTVDLINNEITKNLFAGEYNIQIQALAGDQDNLNLDADPSLSVGGFIKLAPVNIGSITIENGIFKWAAVDHTEKYKVLFEYQDESSAEHEDVKIVDTASYVPPTGVHGTFSLTIWAIGVENEKLFNSNSTTYVSSTVAPNPVKDFFYDDESKNKFIIEVNDDFTNSDKIVIRYNLKKYAQGGNTEDLGEQEIEIKYVHGQTKYYLDIVEMGIYTNITAQVYRQGSVPSKAFLIPSDMIDMNLLDHGSGTEDDPYIICNASQLLNIKYFSTRKAHFMLGSSINFDSIELEDIIANNSGYLISETFNGVLLGGDAQQKFSIYGFNPETQANDTIIETISLQNQHTFALFGSLNGATLKHINFGDQNTTLKLINSFALDNLNMISLSWIAINSVDSTIDDVNLAYRSVDFIVTFNKSEENTSDVISHSGIKIATMFVTAQNTIIRNSSLAANIIVNTNAYNISGSGVYIAGVVAYATDCVSESLNVTFALSGTKKLAVHYLGGIYAYFTGSTVRSISDTNVNININDMRVEQFGGIAGHAKKLDIEQSSISGNYVQSGVNYNFTLGGIIGEASDVNITNCSSFVDFNIAISVTQTKQLIGVIAGNIYKNTISSSIKNCTSHLFEDAIINQTQISSSGTIILGVYGRNKDATIEGCTKATKT